MHSSDRQAHSAAHSQATRAHAVLKRLIETTRRNWALSSRLPPIQSRTCDGAAFEEHLQKRLAVHQRARGLRFNDISAPAWKRERAPEDGMLIWIEIEGLDEHRGREGVADELRELVSERISAYMATDNDPIGCYGVQSFVCLCNSTVSRERAIEFVDGLLKALSVPCRLGGARMRPRPVLGVACFPHDGTNATILLMHAAAAMRRARRHGRGYAFHSSLFDASFAALPPAPNPARVGAIRTGASA